MLIKIKNGQPPEKFLWVPLCRAGALITSDELTKVVPAQKDWPCKGIVRTFFGAVKSKLFQEYFQLAIDPRRIRDKMVRNQIEARGISNPRVLKAMGTVPRHLFVDEALQAQAYEDHPLPIGHGQTISQPYIVALMSSILEVDPGMKVLEIGTGSGYQAAVLAEMGADVYTVERVKPLYQKARKLLADLRYHYVKTKLDDGTMGWPEKAPFDRVLVTAGGPDVPEPLVEQLSDPGILVIPVGSTKRSQTLVKVSKDRGKVDRRDMGSVAFVDLVGRFGW